MPSKKSYRRQRSKRSSQSQSQVGGEGAPQISQETLQQAGRIAQQLLNNMSSSQQSTQSGGSALQGAELTTGGAPPAADAAAAAPEMKVAMTGGAVAGAIAGAEAYSSLKGSPIVGGKKKRTRGGSRQSQSQSQLGQSQSKNQKGGMIPGLLTAVETALVPLGLYLGQKALQSRRSGNRSLGRSFDFRRASRRTRRRR